MGKKLKGKLENLRELKIRNRVKWRIVYYPKDCEIDVLVVDKRSTIFKRLK